MHISQLFGSVQKKPTGMWHARKECSTGRKSVWTEKMKHHYNTTSKDKALRDIEDFVSRGFLPGLVENEIEAQSRQVKFTLTKNVRGQEIVCCPCIRRTLWRKVKSQCVAGIKEIREVSLDKKKIPFGQKENSVWRKMIGLKIPATEPSVLSLNEKDSIRWLKQSDQGVSWDAMCRQI